MALYGMLDLMAVAGSPIGREDVRAAFGDEFLSYVLAKDDFSGEMTQQQQQNAVNELSGFIAAARTRANPLDQVETLDGVLLHVADFGTNTATYLRVSCGGPITEIADPDLLMRHALIVARELYPGFLIARREEFSGFLGHPFRVSRSPSVVEFCRLALEDESLSKLFPGSTLPRDADMAAAYSVGSWVFLSSFTSGHLTLAELPFSMAFQAWRLCAIEGDVSIETYLAKGREVIRQVRELAAGNTIRMPLLVGLSNVSLDDALSVELANAKLTLADSRFVDMLFTHGFREHVEVFLSIDVPLRVLQVGGRGLSKENPYEGFEGRWKRDAEEAYRAMQLNLFALLLGSVPDALICPVVIFQKTLNPVADTGGMGNSRPIRIRPPVKIDVAMADSIASWSRKLSEVNVRSMDVGMRRLISAVTARLDAEDGLVDAVICWENLFGSSTEAVFRVTGAMAKILEPDDQAGRERLVRELKRIYRVRSGLVHGNPKQHKAEDVAADCDSAIRYALAATRRVYENPTLLTVKDSAIRGSYVLLDLHRGEYSAAEGDALAEQDE